MVLKSNHPPGERLETIGTSAVADLIIIELSSPEKAHQSEKAKFQSCGIDGLLAFPILDKSCPRQLGSGGRSNSLAQ